jgi:menaquinone-dependent protoporphyrinogen oxidase
MKTLIIYATKYGATKEIAGRIAARIPGSTVADLKSSNIPPVSQFDCIILGSS